MSAASADKGSNDAVCVAVHIRPLVQSELDEGSREILEVPPGSSQITTGQHTFTYDAVFGQGAAPASTLYTRCVSPLVEGLFKGYNATVFAYGQTGSGKTYTMGSEYKSGGKTQGVIPDAINALYTRIAATVDSDCAVRVSFVEIHKEEVKDLLLTASPGPRPAITIRESPGGGVSLYGAVEREVRTREDMAAVLEMGTLCRSTASTNMNNRSSRSHAIFTITLEQRRQVEAPTTPSASSQPAGQPATSNGAVVDDEEEGMDDEGCGEGVEDYLCAKMHLVDLAGSERAKRTKAEGARLKEGIHINRGLLALGNVINAIVDGHKHVPYRDSKLTRLLQDSLGGNSRTVMIACVSPADVNFEESLNTLRYADRARHIRNKPVVNRDPVAAQVAHLRMQVAQFKAENAALKRGMAAYGKDTSPGGMSHMNEAAEAERWAMVDAMRQENNILLEENIKLRMQLEETQADICNVTDQLHEARAEAVVLRHSSAGGAGGDDIVAAARDSSHGSIPLLGGDSGQVQVIKGYLSKMAELEKENAALRAFQKLSVRVRGGRSSSVLPGGLANGDSGAGTLEHLHAGGIQQEGMPAAEAFEELEGEMGGTTALEGEALAAEEEFFYAEMAAHALSQEKMKKDIVVLQRLLESKEQRMQELVRSGGQVPALKQHYDRVLAELEKERDMLVSERMALMQKLQQVAASSEEERKRIEAAYKDRIAAYDEKLKEVRRKEREWVQMQRLKQRADEAYSRLSADILRIKQQKVSTQKAMDVAAKQFAAWRQERERELVQLRRQNRKNAAQIQHLEAMQAKQNAVLQRKIADATAARKKLKELQDSSHPAAHISSGHNTSRRNTVHNDAAGAGSRDSGPQRVQSNTSDASRPATATGGVTAREAPIDIQPNAQAPLLRTEQARREWLETELDRCNMSFEYRRVIEGELAQRADACRQLKECEKRLMMLDNLTPASPLLNIDGAGHTPGGGGNTPGLISNGGSASVAAGSVTPNGGSHGGGWAGNGTMGRVSRERLLERKARLEKEIAERNGQISELQTRWEAARMEEESKGGGAADVRRWTGLRTIVEARELLRSLFRVACDNTSSFQESSLEVTKAAEELELLRVQLDAARKESDAQRKRAAAIEASAAAAVAASTSPSLPPPLSAAGLDGSLHLSVAVTAGAAQQHDDTDREVDDVLSQLQQQKGRDTPGEPRNISELVDGDGAYVSGLHSPDGEVVVEATPQLLARAAESTAVVKTLDFLSPIAVRHGTGRYLADADSVAGASDEDEEPDGDESEEDESVEDDEWNPATATCARPNRLVRSSATVAAVGSVLASSAWQTDAVGVKATSPSCRRLTRGLASRRSGSLTFSRAGSEDPSVNATAGCSGCSVQEEQAVLRDINGRQQDQGVDTSDKLTVKLLKEHLAGRQLDGRPWRAGNKTKDHLLRDYLHLLQQQQPPPDVQAQTWGSSARAPAAPSAHTSGFSLKLSAAAGSASPQRPHAAASPPRGAPGRGAGPPAVSSSPHSTSRIPRPLGTSTYNTSLTNSPRQPRVTPTMPSAASPASRLPSPAAVFPQAFELSPTSPDSHADSPDVAITAGASIRTLPPSLTIPVAPSQAGVATTRTHRSATAPANPAALTSPMSVSRDYRAAVLVPPSPHSTPRSQGRHSSMGFDTPNANHSSSPHSNGRQQNGRTFMRSASSTPRASFAAGLSRSMVVQGSGGGATPSLRYGAGLVRATEAANSGRQGPAGGESEATVADGDALTPLSLAYMEKAAAARERTAALRQSLQKVWEQPCQEARAAAASMNINLHHSYDVASYRAATAMAAQQLARSGVTDGSANGSGPQTGRAKNKWR